MNILIFREKKVILSDVNILKLNLYLNISSYLVNYINKFIKELNKIEIL